MKTLGLFLSLLLLAPGVAFAQTQGLFDAPSGPLSAVGWAGFRDMHFMAESIGALLLAIALAAVIAFHPTTPRTVDQLHEADMPKVYIMYAFVGAVIGVTVREFGMVIGVVVFGIGGLIRFRTTTDSARDTGRLIIVTLTGLIAGLGLPHLAVITTAFAFLLIFLFDSNPACRVKIDQLPPDRLVESAHAYRSVLHGHGCKIITEHKTALKGRIEFVFRLPRRGTRDVLHAALCEVPLETRGDIDWEIE
ncbi:hypothetical protein [Phenylobacterium sp.]|uniref:hypothetical protein n=1 Tax=Phenylobacterium sp. TaxID=1871053 RepID=UPI0035662094